MYLQVFSQEVNSIVINASVLYIVQYTPENQKKNVLNQQGQVVCYIVINTPVTTYYVMHTMQPKNVFFFQVTRMDLEFNEMRELDPLKYFLHQNTC